MDKAIFIAALEPSRELLEIFDAELDTASTAESRGQKIYRSVQALGQIIGGEYGDRVLFELLQNAHDALLPEGGRVAIHLEVSAPDKGALYVANDGIGFDREDLDALRNIANSSKEVGAGIGNKGVGFRSVEALSDDPHVYSCCGQGRPQESFDGYCFRFARPEEVAARLVALGKAEFAEAVGVAMPRYLATVPVDGQPESVRWFSRERYATVVVLPLRSAEAVALATRQVAELLSSKAPVLLFLRRIASLEVKFDGLQAAVAGGTLSRRARVLDLVGLRDEGVSCELVILQATKWLVIRRSLPKSDVLAAVKRSITLEPGLKRWLEWQGDAFVSVAVPAEGGGLPGGRLYNFLPMGSDAQCPFFGHLDAPFYTAINRERARLDLPLNSYLLDCAAKLCAMAAMALASSKNAFPARCVVDFVAWRRDAARLQAGFAAAGRRLGDAEVWPTTASVWKRLGQAHRWPAGDYKVFTAQRATKAGVQNVLDPKIGEDRLAAIDVLASAVSSTTVASANTIASWAEAVAKALPLPQQFDRWGDFYADLIGALPRGSLYSLAGHAILVDSRDQLVVAGKDVYVRQDGGKKKRTEGAPLPPAALARQLTVLSEEISLKPQTVAAFEQAGLWRHYDASEILERLPTLFGTTPAPARRAIALAWAFKVWKHDSPGARRVLDEAELHVPVRGGWIPASQAAFSQTWTTAGRDLDIYLAEARTRSTDCEAATNALLADQSDWPEPIGADKKEWIRFLVDAGVTDGIVLTAATAPTGPLQGSSWSYRLRFTDDPRMDSTWWSNCDFTDPSHPYTSYWRDGEAWALPGQAVVHLLSDDARQRFAALAIRHLQASGTKHFTFDVLRSDRDVRARDKRSIRTPLATFLGTAAWFPMESTEGTQFVPVSAAWLVRDRRAEPKFIPRAPDEVVELLGQDGQAIEILTGPRFGLRVWRDKRTAADRLKVLAAHCEGVSQHERSMFRKGYEQAWQDLIELDQAVPPDTEMVVERTAGFGRLPPASPAQRLFVRTDDSAELAKLLVDSGTPVLAVGDSALSQELIARLNASGGFLAAAVREADVRLQVDGAPFTTSLDDPLLVDVVPWLAEALVVGHELGARSIERGAHVGPSLERLRRLRLRRAHRIELASKAGATKLLTRHLFRDDSRPTLIVQAPFDTRGLGDASTLVAPYVHPNLRTFELLLLRLSFRLHNTTDFPHVRPTEEDYADAAQADVEAVREHLAAHRHDDAGLLDRLTPLLAYFVGVDVARELIAKLSLTSAPRWQAMLAGQINEDDVARLLSIAKETEDLADARRQLGFDYQRFNKVLLQLGRLSLTSEAELRRLFDLWKDDLSAGLRDRLRRHFRPKFGTAEFAPYAEFRSLDFVDFAPTWVETHETLTRDDVQARANDLFLRRFGVDPGGDLPPLEGVRAANRKAVIRVAERAAPILRAKVPDGLAAPWENGATEIASLVDRAGLLDFHEVGAREALEFLHKLGLWPDDVERSLELTVHGLTNEDLDREKKQAIERQAEERRRRNRVEFLSEAFDAADTEFAARFAALAFDAFARGDWQSRSSTRLTKLVQQDDPKRSERPGGGGGRSKVPAKPPEAVRAAIGLAGELLAYCYLQTKHKDRFSETCWVSENRTSRFPEPGDLTLGYDFRVNTKEREWLYEVKATPGDAYEFELTDNEYRVAISAAPDRSKRYRILFVQYALDPERCRVLELPNPASDAGRSGFRILGRGSTRMRFEVD